MSAFSHCCSTPFRTLTRALAKAASAKLRDIGAARVDPRWPARATICESCPMRVVRKGISYCGKPLLEQVYPRDVSVDGCGCPTIAKAKSPDEHCPLDARHCPAVTGDSGSCNCKWCELTQAGKRVTHCDLLSASSN